MQTTEPLCIEIPSGLRSPQCRSTQGVGDHEQQPCATMAGKMSLRGETCALLDKTTSAGLLLEGKTVALAAAVTGMGTQLESLR